MRYNTDESVKEPTQNTPRDRWGPHGVKGPITRWKDRTGSE